jgi:hypothetical protein
MSHVWTTKSPYWRPHDFPAMTRYHLPRGFCDRLRAFQVVDWGSALVLAVVNWVFELAQEYEVAQILAWTHADFATATNRLLLILLALGPM